MLKRAQRIRNWKDYNTALQKRGEILLSFDKDYLDKLYFQGKQERGGVKNIANRCMNIC